MTIIQQNRKFSQSLLDHTHAGILRLQLLQDVLMASFGPRQGKGCQCTDPVENVPTSAKLGVQGSELEVHGTRSLLQLLGLLAAMELILGKPRPLVVFEAQFDDAIAFFLK